MEQNNKGQNEERLKLGENGEWIQGESPIAKPYWNLSGLRFGLGRSIRPPRILVNVFENENEVYVSADIPGVRGEDIAMKIKGNTLTIFGAVLPEENADGKFFRMERTAGTFSKHVVLPSLVRGEDIDAAMQNGVLMIRLQKVPQQAYRNRLSFI